MIIPLGYQETAVSPNLNSSKASRNVEAYWSFTALDTGESIVLPDGRCDVILRFNIHSTTPPVPIITGPATRAYTVLYKPGDSWLGVRLRPCHGSLLWGKDITDAADKVLRQEEALAVMPTLAKLHRGGLSETALASAVEQCSAFSQAYQINEKLMEALDLVHLSAGRLRIENLAELVGCSSRHLNRMFQMAVGLSVKTYGQLVQFHRALSLISNQNMPITTAALEAGYTDHAHLSRSFKRFGGFSPSKLPDGLSQPGVLS